MLDSFARKPFEPVITTGNQKLSRAGLGAYTTTIIAFILGVIACFTVGFGQYFLAIALLVLTRFLSASANAMAAGTQQEQTHDVITTLCDFIFFGAFAFLFSMGASGHGLAATLLTFSFLVMGVTYLAHACLIAQKGLPAPDKGGLVGYTEMLIFMIAACLYPTGFSFFALFFALLCFVTAGLRAIRIFRILP